MTESSSKQSWWQTLPGVVTAVAALLTAAGGLVGVLHQTGLIGSRASGHPPAESTQAAVGTGAPGTSGPVDTGAKGGAAVGSTRPWSEAIATIEAPDGKTQAVRAETLSYIVSRQHSLTLADGLEIPFERMRSFEIVRADDPNAPDSKAHVVIAMLDGRIVPGDICAAYGCTLIGTSDLGRVEVPLQRVKRVTLGH
jgi:hypothetical protein